MYSECYSIKSQVLEAVRDALIDRGYLTDDGSMKICSEICICTSLSVLEEYFIATFIINDDYTIIVKVTMDNLYSDTLHCGLTVVTSNTEYIDYTDDTFDIVPTK